MGSPATVDIDIYQGDRFELFLRLRSQIWNETTQTWVPGPYIDLTGKTAAAQLKASRDDASPAATFTCTIGDQQATPGAVLAVLTPTQTAALTGQTYYYDLQVKGTADYVTTYLQGRATVTKEVTRV